jgi:hypothetical protein
LIWIDRIPAVIISLCAFGAFCLQAFCFIAIRRLRKHAEDVVMASADLAAKKVAGEVHNIATAASAEATSKLLEMAKKEES